ARTSSAASAPSETGWRARTRGGTTELLPPPAWQRHDLPVLAAALATLLLGVLVVRGMASPALIAEDQLGLHVERPASSLQRRRARQPALPRLLPLAVGADRAARAARRAAPGHRQPAQRARAGPGEPPRRGVLGRRVARSHHRRPRLGAHPLPLPLQGLAHRRPGHRHRHRVRHPQRRPHVRRHRARQREERPPARGAHRPHPRGRPEPPRRGGAPVTRRWLLAAALWPLAAAAVLVPAALRAQGSGVGALPLTMPSVVMVLGVDLEAGELVPMSSGSGTIVSADGAVLTNHHVLHDARGDRLYPAVPHRPL